MSAAPPINLLPDEHVVDHVEFTPRLFMRHLKVTMILTSRRLYVSEPNTILGFIPHGYAMHAAHLADVSDVQTGSQLKTSRSGLKFGLLGVVLLAVAAFVLLYLVTGTSAYASSSAPSSVSASGSYEPIGVTGLISPLQVMMVLLLIVVLNVLVFSLFRRRMQLAAITFGRGVLLVNAGLGDRRSMESMQSAIFAESMRARAEQVDPYTGLLFGNYRN